MKSSKSKAKAPAKKKRTVKKKSSADTRYSPAEASIHARQIAMIHETRGRMKAIKDLEALSNRNPKLQPYVDRVLDRVKKFIDERDTIVAKAASKLQIQDKDALDVLQARYGHQGLRPDDLAKQFGPKAMDVVKDVGPKLEELIEYQLSP